MLSENEKKDILKNIENDINYIFSYHKNQNMWLKYSEKKLTSYETKLKKTKNENLIQKNRTEINNYINEIENHNETIAILNNYYKSYILENLEKIDNVDFKKFVEKHIDFLPDSKYKIISSELYHFYRKNYNADISFVNFNTLMKQLKLKYNCSQILVFEGIMLKKF
jgi:hypothetical protein